MLIAIDALLFVGACAAFVPACIVLAEALASIGGRRVEPGAAAPNSIAVLVPAHNEASIIGDTISNVAAQLRRSDRLIVIADNCSDATAQTARDAGAQVIERNDAAHVGKGFAMQFGIDHLRDSPPEAVIFIDADCRLEDGALAMIAGLAQQRGRPVQAAYDMRPPDGASVKMRVAAFAWRFMNGVRMGGLQSLAGVTRLTGSGMAFPWSIIKDASLASGEIVEDLALSLTMAASRTPAILCLEAVVSSEFPADGAAQFRQASRWSNGSMVFALSRAPGFALRGLQDRNFKLFALACDALVPPLTVLATLSAAAGLATLVYASATGRAGPLLVAAAACGALMTALAVAWVRAGRDLISPAQLPELVAFFASRLAVFGAAGRRSASQWTPTRSDDD